MSVSDSDTMSESEEEEEDTEEASESPVAVSEASKADIDSAVVRTLYCYDEGEERNAKDILLEAQAQDTMRRLDIPAAVTKSNFFFSVEAISGK